MKKFYLKFLFTFIAFAFLSEKAFAYTDDFYLKGGVALTQATVEAAAGTDDKFFGTGFNTHWGYKWKKVEASLSSYIYWGSIDNLQYTTDNQTIIGEGSYRHVSFGPVFKYNTDFEVFSGWRFYSGIGPAWSIQTVKLDNFTTNGDFNRKRKITVISFGGLLSFGIEEALQFKEMHPTYVEFVYSYKKSDKVSIVDTTNPTEINILSTQENHEIHEHYFMLSFGLTVF